MKLKWKLAVSLGMPLLLAYLTTFNYVDQYEVGLGWNWISGEFSLQRSGFHWTPPAVQVTRVDLRPQRVCITSSTKAVNCRLVQFEPKEYKKFLQTEGFRYFWWSNRLSFNFGYHEEYRGMRDVLRGYAYSEKEYPFVR